MSARAWWRLAAAAVLRQLPHTSTRWIADPAPPKLTVVHLDGDTPRTFEALEADSLEAALAGHGVRRAWGAAHETTMPVGDPRLGERATVFVVSISDDTAPLGRRSIVLYRAFAALEFELAPDQDLRDAAELRRALLDRPGPDALQLVALLDALDPDPVRVELPELCWHVPGVPLPEFSTLEARDRMVRVVARDDRSLHLAARPDVVDAHHASPWDALGTVFSCGVCGVRLEVEGDGVTIRVGAIGDEIDLTLASRFARALAGEGPITDHLGEVRSGVAHAARYDAGWCRDQARANRAAVVTALRAGEVVSAPWGDLTLTLGARFVAHLFALRDFDLAVKEGLGTFGPHLGTPAAPRDGDVQRWDPARPMILDRTIPRVAVAGLEAGSSRVMLLAPGVPLGDHHAAVPPLDDGARATLLAKLADPLQTRDHADSYFHLAISWVAISAAGQTLTPEADAALVRFLEDPVARRVRSTDLMLAHLRTPTQAVVDRADLALSLYGCLCGLSEAPDRLVMFAALRGLWRAVRAASPGVSEPSDEMVDVAFTQALSPPRFRQGRFGAR